MRSLLKLLVVVGLVAWVSFGSAFAVEHTKDSLDLVKQKLMSQDAVLIDVREQGEWDAGHLDAATLLPLSVLKQDGNAVKKLPKGKIVYTHCKAGIRSITAAEILEKQGYDVRPLKAGYKDLLDAGFAPAPR